MTRVAVFADISGRVTLDAQGNGRVTAGAVAFDSDTLEPPQSAAPSA